MKLLRRFQYPILFLAVFAFCSYMVAGQFAANNARHADRRDAFLSLCAHHRTEDAQRVYLQLIEDLQKESLKSLQSDQKRTAVFAANAAPSYEDLIWRYHTSVLKELDKRQKRTVAFYRSVR